MPMLKTIMVALLIVPLFLVAAWWLRAKRTHVPAELTTGFYVWQPNWPPAMAEAVARARDRADRFYIHAARLEVTGGEARACLNHPDWSVLARAGRPVVLVVRAPEALARLLATGRADLTALALQNALRQLTAEARAAGCAVAGLQLDYDCPTARLAGYQILLAALRRRLGRTELSITALPTWMESREFGSLVKGLPYYVLQVHGIERPTTISRPIVLCDNRRIGPWLRRASSFKIPYFVALPTYGHRVVFDERGRFAALIAEGPPSALRPGYQERPAMADPAEMAAIVRGLRRERPAGCRGIIWFRLPVAADQLNWPWPTLAAVAEGREPRAAFTAQLRQPSPGLDEVWVANRGEREVKQRIKIPINFASEKIVAHDVMKGFDEDDDGALLGPAPPLGPPRLAAWYRLDTPRAKESIKLGEVQVLP